MNGLADIPFHIRIAGTTLYNDSGDTLRCNIRNSKLHFGPNGIIVTSQEATNCTASVHMRFVAAWLVTIMP
ncbi:hypothetical protein DPMN_047177 [Dreissena polymorpha]|uniref:Uncharacterized protein n=1 Tax=Dreissena polymorpha TaxID=45954 RepID=A0A9D4I2W3_DREPO|nr:hypothetical protein DPMN_047177 [Dreissena polymorpha]